MSKTRSIWANLFLKYSRVTSNTPRSLHLDLPLTHYTSSELEHVILRQKSAEYASREGKLHHTTFTSNHYNQAGVVHLFRGGRWLLSLAKDGSLLCHDLGSPTHEALRLTPPVFSSRIGSAQNVAMSVDEFDGTPTLAARVAIACTTHSAISPAWAQEEHRVDIWYLRLVLHEPAGASARFVAEHMATVPVDKGFARVNELSLRDTQIAFHSEQKNISTKYVAIINWSEVNRLSTKYPRRYVLAPMTRDVSTSALLFLTSIISLNLI